MSRRRGYREYQADAGRDTVTCPRCHTKFVPLGAEGSLSRPVLPHGFPVMSESQLADRIEKQAPATARLHDALRERVGESMFGLWLDSLRLVGAGGDVLYALVADRAESWVKDRFGPVLDEAASTLAGRPVRVVVAAMGGSA